MNKEEAISVLNGLRIPCAVTVDGYSCERNKAIDMAISALSVIDIVDLTNGNTITKAEYDGEPSDLISRAEVIKKMDLVMDWQDTYLPIHFKELVLDEVPSSEPISVRKDGTLFVTVLDAEKVKKVFVNDLQGFYNTFCEEPKQDDDSDYDSLVPDEYKTEPSDLISRADAIEVVRKKLQDWGGYAFEDYRRGLYEAQDILEALPSADAEPKWNCTANFVAEQLERLKDMTDEERWDFFIKFFSPSAEAVHKPDYSYEADMVKRLRQADAVQGFRGGKIPPNEMLNGTVLIPQHKWVEMERELAELKEKFESADAVQGEWIMHIDDLFPCESTQECSVCHAEQPISISDDNYCPSCGARMKGGAE